MSVIFLISHNTKPNITPLITAIIILPFSIFIIFTLILHHLKDSVKFHIGKKIPSARVKTNPAIAAMSKGSISTAI